MLKRAHVIKMLGLVLAAAWLLLFAHFDTTDKSVVRAVLLQHDAYGWTVGFLYQAPEASADAAEAAAEVEFAAAEDQSLELALAAAEKTLPQQANYRLCDYVLLSGSSSEGELLDAYSDAVLQRQCGRLAARVLRCGFSCKELSSASEDKANLPEELLRCVKQAASDAPRLYEREAGLLLPVLEMDENGVTYADEGVFLHGSYELALNANQTQAALLLMGKRGKRTFNFDGRELTLRRGICSTAWSDEGAVLNVVCSSRYAKTKTDEQELEALLAETVEIFWQNGADILGLGAAKELCKGSAAGISPAKNACPQIRADVKFCGIF